MKKNYICLDIGNVLFNQDLEPFVKAISIQQNISKQEATHFIGIMQKKQDLGLTTVADELVAHFNIRSEYIINNLLEEWNKVITPNWHSIEYFSNMSNNFNIEIALLSNMGYDHLKLVGKVLKNRSIFENSNHHFSCQVGARKPTHLYYKLFLDQHPEFNGCHYLDDLEENLEAGQKIGLNTVLWDLSKNDDLSLIKDDLEKFFSK